MRQVNFVIFFVACLLVALFAMQNATPVEVQFFPGSAIKAPLVLELLLAGGLGAVLAWFYTVWTQAQSAVELGKKNQELAEKELYITQLRDTVVNLETALKQLPPTKRAEAEEDTETLKS
ncbi:MAG: hypothetical protein OHK0012_20040 [Synechococcales cyanobacterium]